MLFMSKEYVIGINDPVWLTNPAAPQTSTFDRLHLPTGDNPKTAHLHQLNGRIWEIDLTRVPIHLKHWFNNEATEPDKRVSPLAFRGSEWDGHRPEVPATHEPLYTDINRFAKIEPESNNIAVTSGEQLEQAGVTGFFLRNAGNKTLFPASLIRCIVTHGGRDTITLFLAAEKDSKIQKMTYSQSRIQLTRVKR